MSLVYASCQGLGHGVASTGGGQPAGRELKGGLNIPASYLHSHDESPWARCLLRLRWRIPALVADDLMELADPWDDCGLPVSPDSENRGVEALSFPCGLSAVAAGLPNQTPCSPGAGLTTSSAHLAGRWRLQVHSLPPLRRPRAPARARRFPACHQTLPSPGPGKAARGCGLIDSHPRPDSCGDHPLLDRQQAAMWILGVWPGVAPLLPLPDSTRPLSEGLIVVLLRPYRGSVQYSAQEQPGAPPLPMEPAHPRAIASASLISSRSTP